MDADREFYHAITTPPMVRPGDAIVLGVSGGADSLAMLHLFAASREALSLKLFVLHVHHGIRGEAADSDAAFVRQTCRDWKIPCRVKKVNVPALARKQRMTLEEAARYARHSALYDEAIRRGAAIIAVGHNADDQAETVLMHLVRGSGMAGLRGMLPVQTQPLVPVEPQGRIITLIRPLLKIARADIEAYCAEHGLSPRVDATNADTKYLRNRIRHEVMPLLESINPNVRDALGRTASIIADDYRQLEAQVDEAFDRVAKTNDGSVEIDRSLWIKIMPALRRGVLRRAVESLRGGLGDIGLKHIDDAVSIAQTGKVGAAATLPGGLVMQMGYEVMTIHNAKQALATRDTPLLDKEVIIPLLLPCDGLALWGGWRFSMRPYAGPRLGPEWEALIADRWAALLSIPAGETRVPPVLELRTRCRGDRFQPQGAGGSQKLSDFMINAKIDSTWQDRIPVLVVNNQVAWVCGWRVDQRYIVTPDSKSVWLARFESADPY